jgi:hypothetical protein
MNNKVTLYTSAGGMDIIYLPEFGRRVARHQINQDRIEVSRHPNEQLFGTVDFEKLPVPAISTKEAFTLTKFHTISEMEMVRTMSRSVISEQLYEVSSARIGEEFKIMVAKRNPDFFIKDLNLAAIEELSNKYMENFGGDACGIEVRLSAYQKFFAIADPADFMFYQTQYRQIAENSTAFSGKLVDLKPNKWVMGRYENLEYLKELSASQRYVGPR